VDHLICHTYLFTFPVLTNVITWVCFFYRSFLLWCTYCSLFKENLVNYLQALYPDFFLIFAALSLMFNFAACGYIKETCLLQVVIIACYSGAVSVCSVANLRNLLGESPEFLAGPPRISSLCSDHGFLGLECESTLTSKKSPWDGHTTQSEMVRNSHCV
jgi:hypothetical protein